MKYELFYRFNGCASRTMSFKREDAARRAFQSLISRCSLNFAFLKSEDGSLECDYVKL